MQPIKNYEVIDEDLAYTFYVGTSKEEAKAMKGCIEMMGHIARVVVQ